MKDGYKMWDWDLHTEFWPEQIEPFIDKKYRDIAPKDVTDNHGYMRILQEGVLMPTPSGRGVGAVYGMDMLSPTDLYKAGKLTGKGYLEAIDVEGIDIGVLIPSVRVTRYYLLKDPGLAVAMMRAANDYMAHLAEADPARLLPSCVLPLQVGVEEACEELHRAVKNGAKGVGMVTNEIGGRTLNDPYFDPFYAEVEKLGIPIDFHAVGNEGGYSLGVDRWDNYFMTHMVGHPFEIMGALVSVICGGVCEKFPKLKFLFTEAGCSFVPYWLGRMEAHYRKLPELVPWMKMTPTEYFKRQCFMGVDPYHDLEIKLFVDNLGDDNLVFTSDYPHWDALKPGGLTAGIIECEGISETTKRKILWDNTQDRMLAA